MSKENKVEPRVNYILLINAFWDRLIDFPLKPSSIAVWFYLVYRNNKLSWRDKITIDHKDVVSELTISKNTYYACRDELQSNGYITVEKSANRAFIDSIIIIILYQKLGKEPLPKFGNGVGNGIGNGVGNLDKQETKTINHKGGNDFIPPTVDDVFIFFKALTESARDKWPETFCKEKAQKFASRYSANWELLKKDGWQAKVREWVQTEHSNPKSTNSASGHPDYWSKNMLIH